MKQILIFLFLLFFSFISAQEKSFKEQSIEQFKNENYPLAISLMEKALKENPNDAEVYYYLGFFNHFNAYDSRPLKGYNSDCPQKILDYLDKALELNPNYGDAKYFYLAQCGAVALDAYKENNLSGIREPLEKAYKRGAIPEWAIELGKNMLNCCEKDAILFTHGDFPLDVCLFIQFHFGYRKDVSLVPLAFLDRPSFDIALNDNKNSKVLRGVDLGLTKENLLDMHPYKWDTITMHLPITVSLAKQYATAQNYTMDWVVKPDLYSERTVSRIEGAEIKKQSYLSPARAMLLNILETNQWNRPIYFTPTFENYYLAGLDEYFQDCGMVYKLTPIKTEGTSFQVNVPALENLVLSTKLEKLKTILDNDQPRASNIINIYKYAYYTLADYYKTTGNQEKISEIIEKYKQNLLIGYKSEEEKSFLDEFEKLRK